MKILPLILSSAVIWSSQSLSAASLMLDFGNPPTPGAGDNLSPGPVATGTYLTLSPGHASAVIPPTHSSWNTIINSNDRSDLTYANGTAATGVTLTLGQESSAGNNSIDYSTAITNLALIGTGGGTAGRTRLLTSNSIYGDTRTDSSAVGRDGFFGGGNGTVGSAIGFRVDGLAAGEYQIYLMGRNTNSNNFGSPFAHMTFHTATGMPSGSFANFNSAGSLVQNNATYSTAEYANQYESFIAGENHVVFNITVTAGESLFVAVDGTGSEARGFLNMAQIVAIPEPASVFLGAMGILTLSRRRR